MSALEALLEAFEPAEGKRLLDVGCGHGHLARSLTARGIALVGIDLSEAAVEVARRTAPEARFERAPAEALPFEDGIFDGAVFLNSLHHVQADAMARALNEAARVTKPGGRLVVVEPLAEGSFFEAFRLIEDETLVRRQAQAAVREAVLAGRLREEGSTILVRSETFRVLDDFVARVTSADSGRLAVVARERARLNAAFLAHAIEGPGGFRLEQPLKIDVLAVGSPR